jgi:SEC-C motif
MNHHDPPADPGATGTPSLQELLHQLRGAEGELSTAIRTPLLAAGATVVPALITLVESALADEQTDLGWAPLHAIELLGALGDARAVPVLLRCLDHEDELDLLVQQAAAALHRLGALALDRCLGAYATTPRDAFRDRLAGVMSRWGLHDERIYAALLETLQRTPELGANYLVEYGDARALEVLAQTFDALPIREGDNPLANHVFIELRCAIEDLGGQLTEAQQQKLTQADAPRRRFVAQMSWDGEAPTPPTRRSVAVGHPSAERQRPLPTRKRKLGRNAPCWCGSGTKYKKCHFPLEQG